MTIKTTTLQIGQVYLSEQGEEIHTTLQNSTVMCIYDSKLMISGLCHFLFPSEGYSKESLKFARDNPFNIGDFAIPTLLGLFKKKGSDRNDLEISILGSSIISSADLSNKTASDNINCAENWIEKFGLKLKQKKTGLPEGMQVRVSSNIGGVYLKHFSPSKISDDTTSNNNSSLTPLKAKDSSPFKSNMTPQSSNTRILDSSNSAASSTPQRTSLSTTTTSALKPAGNQISGGTKTNLPLTPQRSSQTLNSNNSMLNQANSTVNRIKSGDTPVTLTSNTQRPHTKTETPSTLKLNEKIRVLIVDDSKTIRNLLTSILETSPQMQIVGQAADAFEAETLRIKLRPDVMTLDIHMPEKDGVTYLEEVLAKDPMPIVMVSDLSLKEASPVMRALELGAFEYFQKPAASELSILAPELINIIKAAYEGRDKIRKQQFEKKHKQNIQANKKNLPPSTIKADSSLRLIAIGASTGGPEAIRKVLTDFPEKTPPIVIVQHMPAKFTKTFADSLNQTCRIKVKEAENGDFLEPSTAYIAPGGFQMAIIESGGRYQVSITDDPPVNRFKPSVDYTFNSLERIEFKGHLNAVILTGMGSDGAYGILGLKRKGCFAIAQDEATCVVYGMPRAAVEYNGVDISLPLEQIAESLIGNRKKSNQSA